MIRVFPRITKATPTGSQIYFAGPPRFKERRDSTVFVSVCFTWDKPKAEDLAEQWRGGGYEVKIGGPAYDDPGGEFIPGIFLKRGYVITSRGCNNNCSHCSVHDREGSLRELPITEGWIVQDNNLLQCSENHIRKVFKMLKRQPKKARFTGGLEARLLKGWHVDLLIDLKPELLYFAYDTPNDYDPLIRVSEMIKESGCISVKSNKLCCYVLIGYPDDMMDEAEARLKAVVDLGLMPFAMLYRDDKGETSPEWRKFQRLWARPSIIRARIKSEAAA